MKSSYMKLCTEFYDITKPEAGPNEVSFYEHVIRSAKGPVLEAMCGSGRLLIPLLKKGLAVEGMDSSLYMLESLKNRCQKQNLNAILYHEMLENLTLPKQYGLIFIAIGSFQLIHPKKNAFRALKNLLAALIPKGQLVIETFVPWDAIHDNIQGTVLKDCSQEQKFESRAEGPNNSYIIHKSMVTFDFKSQQEISHSRYEKWTNQSLSAFEEEEYRVYWYHRYEMELLLEKAGFNNVSIVDNSFENNPQAVIYLASR